GPLLVAAVAYFVADRRYFQSPRPTWPTAAAVEGASAPPVRVPGVLQRIAVCYFFAAAVVLLTGFRRRGWTVFMRSATVVVVLATYWLLVKPESFGLTPLVAAPADHVMKDQAARADGVLHDWIDVQALGDHLYGERPDPEGILSTLPAIATVLLGVLTGGFLRRRTARPDPAGGPDNAETAGWLFLAANVLLIAGLWMSLDFPLNKKIWTSSYVIVTAGLALHFLAACYWLVDAQGYRRWTKPFLVLGTNAIAVYFLSSMGARFMASYPIALAGDVSTDLKTYLFLGLAAWRWPSAADVTAFQQHALTLHAGVAQLASCAMAVAYVAVWCILFIPLYRLRVFIRI
ncbi:MAG: hypothetical protein AB1716_12435, partial [Planctomycetota bacterium]